MFTKINNFNSSIVILTLLCVLSNAVIINHSTFQVRKAPRWNIPWLGLGYFCNGCPVRSCEEDEAIIHGYCCGCARLLDSLPVLCPDFLVCPLNLHGLCHDYEYMMRCCC